MSEKNSTIGAGTQGDGLSKKSLAKATVSGKGSAFKQFENFLHEKGHCRLRGARAFGAPWNAVAVRALGCALE